MIRIAWVVAVVLLCSGAILCLDGCATVPPPASDPLPVAGPVDSPPPALPAIAGTDRDHGCPPPWALCLTGAETYTLARGVGRLQSWADDAHRRCEDRRRLLPAPCPVAVPPVDAGWSGPTWFGVGAVVGVAATALVVVLR